MAITHTWKITDLERYSNHEGLSDVIVAAHWILEAKDENNNFASHWGIQHLDLSRIDTENFISFNSITKDQVIQWVINELNASNQISDEDKARGVVLTEVLEEDLQKRVQAENNQRLTGVPW
jgi:hypothetical protein